MVSNRNVYTQNAQVGQYLGHSILPSFSLKRIFETHLSIHLPKDFPRDAVLLVETDRKSQSTLSIQRSWSESVGLNAEEKWA